MTGSRNAGTVADRSRTLRVDPHVHTCASYDGRTGPTELLERPDALGLDAVAVTDHDTVSGAMAVADVAPAYDVVAIVGCEVSTADGHLLAIGVDDAPEPGRPLPATARRIRGRGGVSVVPHPFQLPRHGARGDAIDAVDGIEVYDAHALTGVRNAQAARFAAREGYPAFGGSDAHRVADVGRAVTSVALPPGTPVSADSVVGALRAGHTVATGRRSSAWRYLTKLVRSVTRKTRTVSGPLVRP